MMAHPGEGTAFIDSMIASMLMPASAGSEQVSMMVR
jgi:hypothetical protein